MKQNKNALTYGEILYGSHILLSLGVNAACSFVNIGVSFEFAYERRIFETPSINKS